MTKKRQNLPVPWGTDCTCGCGRPAQTGYGLSRSCYTRWRYHGFPEAIPPASSFAVGRSVDIDAQLDDYQFIGGPKLTARKAAERLGVSMRTIVRYNARLRAQAAA